MGRRIITAAVALALSATAGAVFAADATLTIQAPDKRAEMTVAPDVLSVEVLFPGWFCLPITAEEMIDRIVQQARSDPGILAEYRGQRSSAEFLQFIAISSVAVVVEGDETIRDIPNCYDNSTAILDLVTGMRARIDARLAQR